MQEIFKPIKDYEELYQVSNTGKVVRITTNKELKHDISKAGYHRVTLCKDGATKRFLVHRLVAAEFITNDENKPDINHIDNNPSNNYVDNLEWCTKSENMQHSRKQGRQDEVDTLRVTERAKLNKAATDSKYTSLIGENLHGRILISYERKLVASRERVIGLFECACCGSHMHAEMDKAVRDVSREKPNYCRSCALKNKNLKI